MPANKTSSTETALTNWNNISGTFSSISGTDLGEGLEWDTGNLYTTGTLTVIPEPPTILLLSGALVALILLRRIDHK